MLLDERTHQSHDRWFVGSLVRRFVRSSVRRFVGRPCFEYEGLSDDLPATCGKRLQVRDNLRDAADSAERNFPERFGRFGPREFARFLDHSRASLLETKNELRVGLRRGYFSDADVIEAQRLTDRALGALSGLQRYLRSRRAEENARRIREGNTRRANEPSRTNEPPNPRTDEP
jgi:four helix bundle protein